jgi:hypothetical protein
MPDDEPHPIERSVTPSKTNPIIKTVSDIVDHLLFENLIIFSPIKAFSWCHTDEPIPLYDNSYGCEEKASLLKCN